MAKKSKLTQVSPTPHRPLFLPKSLPPGYSNWQEWYSQNPNPPTLPVKSTFPKAGEEIDMNRIYHRQTGKETGMFNPLVVKGLTKSSKGALGMAQAMPAALAEYKKKFKEDIDVTIPENSVKFQKWMMGDLMGRNWINHPSNESDTVKVAKALAAYNYGPTNVINTLNKAKQKGIDIYSNKLEWLKELPEETSDYVNKILLAKDPKFEKEYAEVKDKYWDLYSPNVSIKEDGGPIYNTGISSVSTQKTFQDNGNYANTFESSIADNDGFRQYYKQTTPGSLIHYAGDPATGEQVSVNNQLITDPFLKNFLYTKAGYQTGMKKDGGPVYNWIPPNYPRVGARNKQGGWLDKYEYGGDVKKYARKGEIYNERRADELGYIPDAAGHLPSVDYETSEWLKSAQHPTAWKEYLYGYTLNPAVSTGYNLGFDFGGYFGKNQLKYYPKKEDGGSIEDQKIPDTTAYEFGNKFMAYPDKTLTNYQMGTPKSTLPDGKIVDATPEIPAYAHGATVWNKRLADEQMSAAYVVGPDTKGTQVKNTYPDRMSGAENPTNYRIGDVIPTGMDYKSPAAGTYDYNKDVQPYYTMRLHASDTRRMAYGGYVPSYGLGSTVGDIGKLFANTLAAPLEQVTGNNLVNFNYANKGMANAAAVSEGILGGATDIVGTAFLGPAYGMGKGQVRRIGRGIGTSQEYQRGADKWANKTGQLTSSAGNLVAGIASGNPQQIVGGAGELLGTAGSEFNSKALGTIGQLGSFGSMFINPTGNTGGLTNANLGGVGDINVGATDMMFARDGGRITSKYKKRVGIPYAINPGVSNAGMYVGPTTQRGITFADGGDIEVKEVKPTITGGVSAFYQKNAPELPLMGGNISGYFGGRLNPYLSAQGGFGAQRSAMLAGQLGVSPHIKVGNVMFNPSASVGLAGGVNRGYSNYITDPSGLMTEQRVAPTFAGNIFSKAKVKAAYTGLPKNYEFDPYMSAEVIKDPYGTRLPISAGLDFGRDTFVQGSYDPLSNTFGVGAQFNFGGEKNPYKYKGKAKQPKVTPTTRTFADGGPTGGQVAPFVTSDPKEFAKRLKLYNDSAYVAAKYPVVKGKILVNETLQNIINLKNSSNPTDRALVKLWEEKNSFPNFDEALEIADKYKIQPVGTQYIPHPDRRLREYDTFVYAPPIQKVILAKYPTRYQSNISKMPMRGLPSDNIEAMPQKVKVPESNPLPAQYMDTRGEFSNVPQVPPVYTEEQLLKMGYRAPQKKANGGWLDSYEEGGDVDITKPYLNPATVQATLASANKPVTTTTGRVISTPASREKERREKIIAKDPSKYSVEDYKKGIQEPGATNDIVDDPLAMAFFGGFKAGQPLAKALGQYGKNVAAEATAGLSDVGKFVTTKTPLKNAYKINPKALKEADLILTRTQKPGQSSDLKVLKQLEEWGNKYGFENMNDFALADYKRFSRPGYGRGFSSDLMDIDYYSNPNIQQTRGYYEGVPEILKIRLPAKEAAKFNVGKKPLQGYNSYAPNREYLLPENLVYSAESFIPTKAAPYGPGTVYNFIRALGTEQQIANTPHWWKGYPSKKNGGWLDNL